MGTATSRSLGVTDTDLHAGSSGFSAVGKHRLACRGSFRAEVTLGSRRACVTVYVIDKLDGMLLSWFDSVTLGLLPADFPAQIQSVTSPDRRPPTPPPRRRRRRSTRHRLSRAAAPSPPSRPGRCPAGQHATCWEQPARAIWCRCGE